MIVAEDGEEEEEEENRIYIHQSMVSN